MLTQPDHTEMTRRLASMALARTRPAQATEVPLGANVAAPEAPEATAA